jgi:hypothetical protein
MKRLAAHIRGRLVGDADREQHLAVGCALAHGVIAVVGEVHVVLAIDEHPVCALE